MAQQISHLPHIKNVKSGINLYDPNHSSIFEVYIDLPQALLSNGFTEEDGLLLTQQVTNVSGLDVLQKTPDAGQQKFFGVDVSYANPTLDNTYAEITMNFNLNLRNVTDNFVLKIFKAWANLNYDLSDGTRSLKTEYISPGMRIAEANRNGVVWRSYRFNHVILKGISNIDSLDYTQNEARQLTVVFRSDYWDDDMG